MKKISLLLLLTIFITTGCGNVKETKKHTDSMRYKRVLIVGLDDEFAPMGFRNEAGEIIGFDIDLANEAARRMGVELEYRPIDWDNKEFEITSGNIDMIWNGCDIMESYKDYMIFSKPYMQNRQILLVKDGNRQNINSEYHLAGKVVATRAGSVSEDYINSDEDFKNSFAAFKTYRNIKEEFDALISDEVDVMIVDEIAGRYAMISQPGNFEIINVTIGPVTEFGIGFRKGNTALRDKVQGAFDDMIKDGTAKRISENWFQADLIK